MKFLLFTLFTFCFSLAFCQVDTSYIYNNNTPYGSLDIRIAKSPTHYYYLQEGVTFSFRETSPGVKTNNYLDMTSWDSSPYEQGNLRETNGTFDNFVMNYRLLKPANYDPSYSKGYPLIIMFHGSGEHGNCWHSRCYHATPEYDPVENNPAAPTDPELKLLNNDHNLLNGGKVYLEAVNAAGSLKPDDASLPPRAFPGFILFPQNLNGWNVTSVQDALRLLRLVVKKYNIDEDRIYINGLSHGAHGVFEALKRAPWMFSAAIVMSAVDDAFITNINLESALVDVPVWYFQGELDKTPYPAKTQSYIRKFRAAGVQIRYTEYEGIGHSTWNRAYNEPDFFAWMLGIKKSQVKSFGGSTAICSASGLELQQPEGHFAYQWQKDGQLIPDANAYTYVATTPGKYSGRFSRVSSPAESDWNEWSEPLELTAGQTPTAEIIQIGSVVMKDPNGNNVVQLESKQDAGHYYWFKDDVLIDFPGNQDDTLKSITLNASNCNPACSSNGKYTLKTTDYNGCESTVSNAKFVFFNNQAPIGIATPGDLTAENIQSSSVVLKWMDNSNNEDAFELWRRMKDASNNYTQWVLVTLTEPNTISYQDTALIPSNMYEYIIRGTGAAGRSNYSPASAPLQTTTASDNEAPSAPEGFELIRKGLDGVLLVWQPSNDNAGIQKYVVSYADKVLEVKDTMLLVTNLQPNTEYTFTLVAVDWGNNSSEGVNKNYNTGFSGVYYEHSPGDWPSLDSIYWSNPEYIGYQSEISLKNKTQDDYFYFRFKGYLYITTAGNYKFRITSDDGSRLYINNNVLINNDGIHELQSKESSPIELTEGGHQFQLDFFDYSYTDSLAFEYNGPDTQNEWRIVSSEVLKSTLVVAAETPLNKESFTVYPNPSTADNVRFMLHNLKDKNITVDVLDPMGKLIHQEVIYIDSPLLEKRIQIEQNLKSGLYILQFHVGNQTVQRRLMIR